MCKALDPGRTLLALLGSAAVDAWAEVGIDGCKRVHGLVAQPAAPSIAYADFVEIAHGRRLRGRV